MTGTVQLVTENRAEGVVARLTLDRPAKRNALTSSMIVELRDHALRLAQIADVRVVVLTGAGHSFAAGADVNELALLKSETAGAFIQRLHEAFLALRALPVPVIASIRGTCLGAAMEMAASCDLRLADREAVFGMPEVRVGLPSVIEAALLPRLVGWGKACDLMITGELINAEEAHRCGFVQRLAGEPGLDEAVEQCVASILQGGPRAIRLQKSLFREWERLALNDAVERGISFMIEAYATDEPRSLQKRFLDRRQPRADKV